MPHVMKGSLTFLGRIALSAIFLASAVSHIANPAGSLKGMVANGMPGGVMGGMLLFGAIAFLLVGGLMLLTGFGGRWGAVVLMLFLIPTTLKFHDFWADPAEMVRMERIQFMKNLAIFGGLMFVVAYGTGPLSMKAFWRKRTSGPATAETQVKAAATPTVPPMREESQG